MKPRPTMTLALSCNPFIKSSTQCEGKVFHLMEPEHFILLCTISWHPFWRSSFYALALLIFMLCFFHFTCLMFVSFHFGNFFFFVFSSHRLRIFFTMVSICKARQARLLKNVNKHFRNFVSQKQQKTKMGWKAHKSAKLLAT